MMIPSLDDQHAVHVRVQFRRAALRRTVKVVAARVVDFEGDRKRRADHRTVDEHALIETVEREAVAGAEPVVSRRKLDLDDLTAFDADFGWLVLPRMLAELDGPVRCAEPLHALCELPLLIA